MEVLLPSSREKRKQARSQSTPVRTSSAASEFGAKIEEIPDQHTESESKLRAHEGEQTPARKHTNEIYQQSHLADEWSHLESDQYGTELARDARVWKVYVGETDRSDRERVDGWDKSMDVLLVFAALFSAVTGAFLIESSKLLKEDPADVSAAALRAIAQVLVPGANSLSTAMDPPTLPPPEGSFVPRKVAVIVNTLWYMSLSLSIATAFLAMLAKDWCYSFLAHRTGHPRDQAHRRQRKWKLIERWKMEEVITVLPSLMHLSLLVFAVGLCIYLWDLNSGIAIPVMCIAGGFLAFYIWSSTTASLVEDFPYTTIISRVIRSRYLQVLRKSINRLEDFLSTLALYSLGGIYFIYLFLVTVLFLALSLVPISLFLSLNCLLGCFWLFGCFTTPVEFLNGLISRLFELEVDLAIQVALMPILLLSDLFTFIGGFFEGFELPDELVTSLALSWLIEHCGTPSAVDIALQAIAGANQSIPKDPLLASQAIELIMRRIVSHDAHDDGTFRSRLYIRALATLGLSSSTADQKRDITGDIGVMIWDLKLKNESEIADLIEYQSFVPNEHNLQAMRVGNSAASRSLDVLMGEATNTSQTFDLINKLLCRHCEFLDGRLHLAAVQSLANAASLHIALSARPELPPGLINLFMRHCEHLVHENDQAPRSYAAMASFIMCVLLNGHPCGTGEKPLDDDQAPNQLHTRALHAIRTLTDIKTEGPGFRSRIFWVGCSEVLSNPTRYGLKHGENDWKPLRDWCSTRCSDFVRKRASVSARSSDKSAQSARNKFLRGIGQVYELIELSRLPDSGPTHLPGPLHAMLTIVACGNPPEKGQSPTCNELLAKFGFPILNEASIASLELRIGENEQTLLSAMGEAYTSGKQPQKHFAATQLWFLLHLVSDPSSSDQQRLQTKLEHELEDCLQLQNKGLNQVKLDLEAFIIDEYRSAHKVSLGAKQLDGEKQPPTTWEKIKNPSLKWLTGSNTQNVASRGGNGVNEVKGALGINREDRDSLEKHQKAYTARVIELILETRGVQGNDDLLPLIADDFKALPSYLQRFTPTLAPLLAPLFEPLPPSRIVSRVSTQTIAEHIPYTTTELPVTGAGHVIVEVQGLSNTPNSEDRHPDLGNATLSNDVSHM